MIKPLRKAIKDKVKAKANANANIRLTSTGVAGNIANQDRD